jgi:glyoxylase-like metal-dependent hydrolase (beta-lactamase superfamily II)
MKRFIVLAVAGVFALAEGPFAQQANSLKAAADALGATNTKTLQITGSGKNFSVGQNYTPAEAYPPVTVKSFTEAINFDTGSARIEMVREMGAVMPRGGGAPFFGEQRQVQLVSGTSAWNMAPAAPGGQPAAQPQPGAVAERMLQLWSTPQGFVKAAMANSATTKSAKGGTEVSFTIGGKYKMTGIINAQNEVARVQTWIDSPVLGDMLVETTYTGYKDFGGVKFPTHIVQTQGGYPALDLTVTDVKANVPVDLQTPQNVRTATAPPVRVDSEQVADGVFYLRGGTHHSVAVAMKDYIVLVECPLGEERASAVIAKAKELIPNKPIRYVVNTHNHWDHSGGLRTCVDEGATIVTQQQNKGFYEKAWAAPHTLSPDKLSQSKKKPTFMTVGDKGQLTDGTRTIELNRLQGYEHTGTMLVAYLPKEKILIEADAFTPPPNNAPLIPPAVPAAKALNDNVQRLKLDVAQILPLHGPGAAKMADLEKAVASKATN